MQFKYKVYEELAEHLYNRIEKMAQTNSVQKKEMENILDYLVNICDPNDSKKLEVVFDKFSSLIEDDYDIYNVIISTLINLNEERIEDFYKEQEFIVPQFIENQVNLKLYELKEELYDKIIDTYREEKISIDNLNKNGNIFAVNYKGNIIDFPKTENAVIYSKKREILTFQILIEEKSIERTRKEQELYELKFRYYNQNKILQKLNYKDFKQQEAVLSLEIEEIRCSTSKLISKLKELEEFNKNIEKQYIKELEKSQSQDKVNQVQTSTIQKQSELTTKEKAELEYEKKIQKRNELITKKETLEERLIEKEEELLKITKNRKTYNSVYEYEYAKNLIEKEKLKLEKELIIIEGLLANNQNYLDQQQIIMNNNGSLSGMELALKKEEYKILETKSTIEMYETENKIIQIDMYINSLMEKLGKLNDLEVVAKKNLLTKEIDSNNEEITNEKNNLKLNQKEIIRQKVLIMEKLGKIDSNERMERIEKISKLTELTAQQEKELLSEMLTNDDTLENNNKHK